MKRRKFIQNLGLSIPPVFIAGTGENKPDQDFPQYNYTQPASLDEAVTSDGRIIVRLEFTGSSRELRKIVPEISVKDGNLQRSKEYFFEPGEDDYFAESQEAALSLDAGDTDVIVLWLDKFSKETTIQLQQNSETFSFSLAEIVENLEVKKQLETVSLKANFLLDKEIGEIEPADVGIHNRGNNFSFILMADPQGGDTSNPDDNRCRMKIHNAFIEESVRLANEIKTDPAFCLMVGDIVDHQGEARDFAQMKHFFDRLEMPVLYEMGNHESRYRTTFEPGYNLSDFNNYFAAQKAINGMEKLLYSFNLGEWHFVVWPDPLRRNFWENHPHYFDWLERDLEKYKDKPTLFFQHIPMHPIGINPLVNYAESVSVKRQLFEILSKRGNVKSIFSGHVHIPVKSSFKTAVSVNGINCYNLPAAGYRPRAFGEQDYYGGPAQGICIVDVKGKEFKATYKTVTLEEFTYPEKLTEFEKEKYPLWLANKWELPAEKSFVNGDFREGMKGWGRRYVYTEDENPSNICEVRNWKQGEKSLALYIKTQKRGYHKPGQDRLPQGINRAFQAVQLSDGEEPFVKFEYRLDGANCDFEGFYGLYIWVEGFQGSARLVNLLYFANKAWVNLGNTYNSGTGGEPVIFSLDNTPDKWHKVQLNIRNDFETNKRGLRFFSPQPDRLVVSTGIWNINDGPAQPFAAYLKNFELKTNLSGRSEIDGNPVDLMPDERKWWRGKLMPSGNIAGEHHYYVEGWNNLKY